MFEYFKDNYQWSLSTMMALEMGAPIGEVHDACRSLLPLAGTLDGHAEESWYQAWRLAGERCLALARSDESRGCDLSASAKNMRAAIYLMIAERHLPHTDPRKIMTYREELQAFGKGLSSLEFAVEHVDIPYAGSTLPALFVPAEGDGPAPCLIMLNGLDSTKEMVLLFSRSAYARRGISLLICDQPGTGGALRLNGLVATHRTEEPVSACIDYLEQLPDVAPERIGVLGISLGGYYAPRAAAFEQRLQCCVAWGGIWDLPALLSETWEQGVRSVEDFQLHWVFGTDDRDELNDMLRSYTLDGSLDGLSCPLLVVHGGNDRQAPLWTAQKTYEAAVNSERRELKVFDLYEGAAEHCQLDNVAPGVEFMSDWVAEALKT